MSNSQTSLFEEVSKKLSNTRQSHLLKFCKDETFLKFLNSFNYEELDKNYNDAKVFEKQLEEMAFKAKPYKELSGIESSCRPTQIKSFEEAGLTEIAKGNVAVVGLSSNIHDNEFLSIGCYYPELLSRKSVFQLNAEKIRKVQNMSTELLENKNVIPWYIMINHYNLKSVKDFFKSNSYFGLHKKDVIFICQNMNPVYGLNDKILQNEKNEVCTCSDGTGGLFEAFQKHHIFKDLHTRNITHIFVYNLDNLLVRIADPVFLGYCLSKTSDCCVKVFPRSSTERNDVLLTIEDRILVLDQNSVPQRLLNLKEKEKFTYGLSYAEMQIFTVKFLEYFMKYYFNSLPYHLRKVKLSTINSHGIKHTPDQANALLLKKFISDCFQYSDHFSSWEITRQVDYSCLEIIDGKVRPWAVNDLFRLHKSYIEQAGGIVKCNQVEISPLLSYAGEDLKVLALNKIFEKKVHLLSNDELEKMQADQEEQNNLKKATKSSHLVLGSPGPSKSISFVASKKKTSSRSVNKTDKNK